MFSTVGIRRRYKLTRRPVPTSMHCSFPHVRRLKNRRKYPRADVSNPCTITLKDSDTTFSGQLDNISANGFAFLIRDPFFMDHKHADVAIDIQNFALRISPIWKDMLSGARMMKVYILWDVRCRKTIMQYAIM